MSSPATLSIPHAYRHILRHGLRAIQYSTPARYTMTTLLRDEFRPLISTNLTDEERHSRAEITSLPKSTVENICAFFHRCAEEKGIEHDVIRNQGLAEYWRWSVRKHLARPGVPKGNKAQEKVNMDDEYAEVWRALRDDLVSERVKVDRDMDIRMQEGDPRFKHNPPPPKRMR